jgi:hypothetical protein
LRREAKAVEGDEEAPTADYVVTRLDEEADEERRNG